jgi:hypothetical protein
MLGISVLVIAVPRLITSVSHTPIHWLLAKVLQLCLICVTTGALFVMNFPLALCVLIAVSVTLLPIRSCNPLHLCMVFC